MSGARTADPEAGKTYDVEHSRKGKFRFRVTRVDDRWVAGEIISGKAKYASGGPALPGDKIEVTSRLATFTLVDEGEKK